MNDIRKTIGYADLSWNFVTGCYHDCPYCYARKIATRFRSVKNGKANEIYRDLREHHGCLVEHDPSLVYPMGFVPTFYPHRLDEPAKRKKPARILVGDMTDLFGDWVPQEWIEAGLDATVAAPWHQYLFLSKNIDGLVNKHWQWFIKKGHDADCSNWWMGLTVTDQWHVADLMRLSWQGWVSFEPLLGPIDLSGLLDALEDGDPLPFQWAVVGALNGGKRPAETEKWADALIRQLRGASIPVWVKGDLYQTFPIREYPQWKE